MRLLDISEETNLEVSIKGDTLIIKPAVKTDSRNDSQIAFKGSSRGDKENSVSVYSNPNNKNDWEELDVAASSKAKERVDGIADRLMDKYEIMFKKLAKN